MEHGKETVSVRFEQDLSLTSNHTNFIHFPHLLSFLWQRCSLIFILQWRPADHSTKVSGQKFLAFHKNLTILKQLTN